MMSNNAANSRLVDLSSKHISYAKNRKSSRSNLMATKSGTTGIN
jgi:hypothetical protein